MKKVKKRSKVIYSSIITCPVCGKKSFNISQVLDDIPHFGEVLETFAHCDSCGYKAHDILPLSEKRYPIKQKIKISSKSLAYRVIKSKYCTIEIPELGIKIQPGPNSESYISNVEGVIDRIIDGLKRIKTIKEEKKKEIEKLVKKLLRIKEKGGATLVFYDRTGQSAIIEKSN